MVLRGSTNDGYPVLVLDRSGLAMITDRSIGLVKLYCLFRQSSWERYPLTVVLLARFGILAEFRIVKSASKVGEVSVEFRVPSFLQRSSLPLHVLEN
ncbi:hypothetical protein PIB30_077664 [Stylosanthes scabra]|uniref:Uncharacterized protein n=1 Tax=Stylosanthes scabra TaxID=79078 RepID=A0ABU6UTB5_9FABA|nr:hypothetical protein [Stylosanthes scabra]